MSNFVYRVENSKGEGMYMSRDSLNECPSYQHLRGFENMDRTRHPLPSGKMRDYGWNYAFESPHALYQWLYDSSWIKYLREKGFSIVKYETDFLFKEDSVQCVFPQDQAKIVGIVGLSIFGPAQYI